MINYIFEDENYNVYLDHEWFDIFNIDDITIIDKPETNFEKFIKKEFEGLYYDREVNLFRRLLLIKYFKKDNTYALADSLITYDFNGNIVNSESLEENEN